MINVNLNQTASEVCIVAPYLRQYTECMTTHQSRRKRDKMAADAV